MLVLMKSVENSAKNAMQRVKGGDSKGRIVEEGGSAFILIPTPMGVRTRQRARRFVIMGRFSTA